MNRISTVLFLSLIGAAATGVAHADVSRTEVLDRAKAYVFYPWRATAANQNGSCNSSYGSGNDSPPRHDTSSYQ